MCRLSAVLRAVGHEHAPDAVEDAQADPAPEGAVDQLSSGTSSGRRCHWTPLRSRYTLASSAARGSMRRRPAGLGGSAPSRMGATLAHGSSGTRRSQT